MKSRRVLTAIGTVVTIALQDVIGIPEDKATSNVAIAVAWIVGDSHRATE